MNHRPIPSPADVLLLVSPAVAPCCWGLVLFECVQRGFTLRGVQRLQLIPKAAKALGLTSSQVRKVDTIYAIVFDCLPEGGWSLILNVHRLTCAQPNLSQDA